MIDEPPIGIVLTVSRGMWGGTIASYKRWITNFTNAMERNENGEDMYYWFRANGIPKHKDLQYIYLSIGNKIRYRCIFATAYPGGTKKFENGKVLTAKAWILAAGPAVRAPRNIEFHGRRGFRYTHQLF